MSLRKTICRVLVAVCGLSALLVAAACGPVTPEEPAGETTPVKAVLTLSTSGTPEDGSAVGGLGVTVVLPDTVSVPTTNGSPDSGVVAASGPAAGQATVLALFSAATETAPARLSLVVAGGGAGLTVGEFATITVDVINGNSPVASDFGMEGFSAVDTSGAAMPGLAAGLSLSLQ